MRIAELNLQAFGPFSDRLLSFSAEDGLVVLYGPNEAGKSSMLRALKAWLYGIPVQSTDNFIHEHQKMRVAGRLCLSSGHELTFVRRKGNKRTVLDLSGNPLDDGALDAFLSQVGEDAFSRMFGIDNEALVRGGRELLEDKGDVGQALFAAGMSGLQLRRVLQTMEQAANGLFKSGGSKQEIAEALKQLTEVRKKTKEESVSGKDMNELEDHLIEAQASVSLLDVSLTEAMTDLTRFERIEAALPKLAKRVNLQARLKEMHDVPLLSDDFPNRRREVEQEKRQASKEIATHEPELERLAKQLEGVLGAGGLAPFAEKIESLFKRLGAHDKAQRDVVGLEAKHESCVRETHRLLADIRSGLPLDDLGSLRVTDVRTKRIKDLALRRDSAFSAETTCHEALNLATDKLQEAQQKVESLPQARDESELERTVDGLQKHGDLVKTVRVAQQQHQAFADDAKAMLARLGLWSGTLEDLERLPVPTEKTVGRFQDEFDEVSSELKANGKHLSDLAAQRARIEGEIESTRRKGTPLTDVELGDARTQRDGTWQRIRGAWLDGQDVEETPPGLARRYENEVKSADDIVDVLRANADQVAEHAEQLRQQERIQKEFCKASAERQHIEERREQLNAEWEAIWTASSITPLPPREMLAWLNRYAQLLERGRQIRAEDLKKEEALQDMAAGVQALNACLKSLGEHECGSDDDYTRLIEHCKALVSNLRSMNNARAAAEKSVTEIDKERRRAERGLDQAIEKRKLWQQEWAECMKWLEIAQDTSIGDADSYLERLEDLFKHANAAADLEERIAGIRKDTESLEAEVRGLVETIAPSLKNRGVAETIEELQRRAVKDINALTEQREYRKQHADMTRKLDGARATLAEADHALQGLCEEARCEDVGQLEQIERRSADRRGLMRDIEHVEDSLHEIAKGMTLEALSAEGSDLDADTLPALIDSANATIDSLRKDRDQKNQNIGQIAATIQRLRGQSGAAQAAEAVQECLALIEEKTRQYTKLKLASIVLRTEIKKYQTINQGPLMTRAGELFARLTLGSFSGLSVSYSDKDEPYMLGVRPTETTVPVEGMSDGTRDQLYLALRLATLERFLENSEPMPVIVDDILIRFDDERARATLEVLAELAMKTQVLFFTHHARLFEFARSPEMVGKVHARTMQN